MIRLGAIAFLAGSAAIVVACSFPSLSSAPTPPCACPPSVSLCGPGCAIVQCNSGFADCDRDPVNGCEVDTASDPSNCGLCGNRCEGTTCGGSSCGSVEQLSQDDNACALALSGGMIIWVRCCSLVAGAIASDGAIRTMPTSGGKVATLVDQQRAVGAVVADGSTAYWINSPTTSNGKFNFDGQLVGVATTGGMPNVVATGFLMPALAMDSIGLYAVRATGTTWTPTSTPGSIERFDRFDGGVGTIVSSVSEPFGAATGSFLSLRDHQLWWVEPGSVSALDLDGGVPESVASGPLGMEGLGSDDAGAFWGAEQGQNEVIQTSTGGPPASVAVSPYGAGIAQIASDGEFLYVAETAGIIRRVSRTTGASLVLAGGQSKPTAIAVDATNVYWANQGIGKGDPNAGIMKMAKP